jgi:hypothetical protein
MSEIYPSRSKGQRAAYNKQYYRENAAYFKDNARRRAHEIRDFIRQQKEGLSCKRCGNTDIRVLDFHHLDKDGKDGGLSYAKSKGWSKERILREIAKCEVLCANCHRIVHWEEWNEG